MDTGQAGVPGHNGASRAEAGWAGAPPVPGVWVPSAAEGMGLSHLQSGYLPNSQGYLPVQWPPVDYVTSHSWAE